MSVNELETGVSSLSREELALFSRWFEDWDRCGTRCGAGRSREAKQLGWIPPRPLYILRMLLTLRRERRLKL